MIKTARFYGKVGFERTLEMDPENHPGVFEPIVEAREYYGDLYQNSRRWEPNGNSINETPVVSNRISIVADSYAYSNVGAMRYVEMNGVLWKIISIDIERPRIVLTIGGIYNGPKS